jgi:hypothetical protein
VKDFNSYQPPVPFPSSGCHSLALNSVSTSSTTPFEPSSATSMETLTVHLRLDELVDHWTLLAGESDLRQQARCAVRRDRAGGLLLWSGPHLIFHGLTARPIRRSPSHMVPAPVR